MEAEKIRDVLEALLFSADVPLRAKTLSEVLGDGVAVRDVNAAVKELNARYVESGASFRIEEIAGGLQLLTRPDFDAWIRKLAKARQRSRLSRAALETLAIVAYRQPLTRPAVEAIRGVDAGGVLGTLLERGLVRIAGRAETVGRPLLYATTPTFLNHFGLKSLAKLPRLEEIGREMDRRGLLQEVAMELGEDPETLDGTIDAFIARGDRTETPEGGVRAGETDAVIGDASGGRGAHGGDRAPAEGASEAHASGPAAPTSEADGDLPRAPVTAAPSGETAATGALDASGATVPEADEPAAADTVPDAAHPARADEAEGPSIDAPGPASMTVAELADADAEPPAPGEASEEAVEAEEEEEITDSEGDASSGPRVGTAREAL